MSTEDQTASTAPGWVIRPAAGTDWPAVWEILEPVIRAGETFTWDRDTTEHQARERWFKQAPGQTFVAAGRGELAGVILGTGELHANQGGGGSHVANAGYMVHPAHGGKGVARALCAYSLDAARAAGFRAMQFNAVVEAMSGPLRPGGPWASRCWPPSRTRSCTRAWAMWACS
ncbi:GNAT family N-acetyltransferase [Pseudarthrobacter sp. ATCC 49987]|uniref:GNAT family N-acetyltransferase n=1 Tax=Pseudarthrobacter sp. ATCC 49987 TaxID=2698204 RepID=UPI003075D0BC